MNFELIDYSDMYFNRIRKVDIPQKRSGKFIHIFDEAEEREYVILSPRELSIYHANIVDRFCMLQKIKGSYNSKKDHFTIHEGDWVVAGGGMWVIDEDKKTLELSGTSKAYGAFRAEGLRGRIMKSSVFPGYSVIVNGS